MQDPAPVQAGGRHDMASPKLDRAREVVRPLVEANRPINRQKLAAEHDLTLNAIQSADLYERGRLEGLKAATETATAPIDTSVLNRSAQEKFAALEQRLRARLEAAFHDRVHQEVVRHIEEYLMPHYRERLEKADLLMKIGKPFSHKQFLSLLGALHPDTTSAERRHDAFILLKAKEILLRPEEKDRVLSSGLPTSVAELLAMKKARRPAS